MSVKENIAKLRLLIPPAVTIVAVSKGRSVNEIKEAITAGIADIGENKVQEALLKYNQLRAMSYELRWHMVGHLQSNKVKDAVRIFDLIHSVDSLHLAQEIDKQAAKIDKVQDVLIEVKTSQEATKFGVTPEKAMDLIKQVSLLKNIKIRGLMTIAPLADNSERARSYFRLLRDLRDKAYGPIAMSQELILSMGMTDDYKVAIEEGSNMVRIGRAVFK